MCAGWQPDSYLEAAQDGTPELHCREVPSCLAYREPGREEPLLAHVIGEAECSAVLGGRLRPPPEPAEEIGARGGQEMIAAQRRGLDTVERSEEHTSELQSLTNLVCRLLFEK